MDDFCEGPSLEGEMRTNGTPMRDVLISVNRHENHGVPDTIRSIDIGSLFPQIRDLRESTASDRREHGTNVGLTRDGRLHIDEPSHGKRGIVSVSMSDYLSENGLLLVNMHTHPPDGIQSHSVRDISHLLQHKGLHVGEMVITDNLTTLIMRGPHTPVWDPNEADEKFEELNRRGMSAQNEGDYKGWNLVKMVVAAGKAQSRQSRHQKYDKYAGFLREVIRENDLRCFSGDAQARVLKLQAV